MNYAATVGNTVLSLTVTPTVTDSTATIRVNGASVSSGVASSAQSLSVGANTILLNVTAQDGASFTIYSIIVTRNACKFTNR